jgi:hypothetical protein
MNTKKHCFSPYSVCLWVCVLYRNTHEHKETLFFSILCVFVGMCLSKEKMASMMALLGEMFI